uniref:Myb-like domain-containing protein n=1 Tax=viral metagenome TaxID=1070528 RepID=A0A6C0KAE4_9ZZZZ
MQHASHASQTSQYRYNRRSNFDELRKNETTSRAGLGWEAGEEEKLLSMRLEKSSYDDIANELKRTSRSIQTRLYQNVCKSVETDNEDEASLIQKYDIDYDDFVSFKTQRQEKLNKFESRKEATAGAASGTEGRSGASDGSRPYRKSRRYDTPSQYTTSSQYTTPYENKNYNMRNELSTLRQEVYELRRIVNELRV